MAHGGAPWDSMSERVIRVAVLTVSDRSARGEREDLSGPALQEAVLEAGWEIVAASICEDEIATIAEKLRAWVDDGGVDLVLTTGGTGFAPRDVTPEATRTVIERESPGLVEAIRAKSLAITSHAMLSRAVAGIRGHTLIVNLPGNPRGAVEALEIIRPVLPHAASLLRDDGDSEAQHRIISD